MLNCRSNRSPAGIRPHARCLCPPPRTGRRSGVAAPTAGNSMHCTMEEQANQRVRSRHGMRELPHPHPQCSRACRPDGVDAKQREATHDGSTQHGRCHLPLSCGRLPKGNRSCGYHAAHPQSVPNSYSFCASLQCQKAECRVPSSSWSTSTSTWATQVLLAIAGQSQPFLTPGIVMS